MQRGPEWREQIKLHRRRVETAKLQRPHQLSWVSFSFFSTSLWSIRGGRFTPKNWTNATTKWWQLVAKLVTNAQLYFTSPPQNTFGQFLPVGVWAPLSVKTVCPILQEDIYPIMISSIVLKSVLWRGPETARAFWNFKKNLNSFHPNVHSLSLSLRWHVWRADSQQHKLELSRGTWAKCEQLV